jgi:hypothetical protein
MVDAISISSPTSIKLLNKVADSSFNYLKMQLLDQPHESTTKNVIEEGKVIVEEYDRHGRLIRKTPPGYLPPGQKF